MLIDSFRQLDHLLRGDATRLPALEKGTIDFPARRVAAVGGLLGVAYGLCMGAFAGLRAGTVAHQQFIASAIKVPLLFGLTLMVTFPSLYVFNALVGSRLTLLSLLRLLTAAMGVTLAVLASLGPIVAFFSLSTTSYPFMVLLNVVVFAASGSLGLTFLLQTLHRLSLALSGSSQPTPTPAADEPVDLTFEDSRGAGAKIAEQSRTKVAMVASDLRTMRKPGALDSLEGTVLGSHVKTVFRIWLVVFGLVGAQMSWVLRPFIGDPAIPFTWLQAPHGNFFEGVFTAISHLFR